MKKHLKLFLIAGAALALCGPAAAQQETKQPPEQLTAAKEPARPTPVWTDPQLEKVGAALTGTWKSAAPIASGGESFDVVVSAAPVFIKDLPNAMYCEIARADALRQPYRQTILTLNKNKAGVRLQTYEFRRRAGRLPSAYTMWAAPDAFPSTINSEDLLATLAIDLKADGDGWKGATPHAYPSDKSGAVEMTSEMSIKAGAISLADRGFDADGKQVWGPETGKNYAFKTFDSGITVTRMPGG